MADGIDLPKHQTTEEMDLEQRIESLNQENKMLVGRIRILLRENRALLRRNVELRKEKGYFVPDGIIRFLNEHPQDLMDSDDESFFDNNEICVIATIRPWPTPASPAPCSHGA